MFFSFMHKRPWQRIGVRDWNTLMDFLKTALNFTATGPGVKSSQGPFGRTLSIAGDSGGTYGKVYRAQAEEGATADGELSVKLLDAAGAVMGDAFDVYVFQSKAATDFTAAYYNSETGALFVNNDYLSVYKDSNGDWIMCAPALVKISAITVQTTYDFADPNFQIKTRANVIVLGADAESAWTTQHTGSDC